MAVGNGENKFPFYCLLSMGSVVLYVYMYYLGFAIESSEQVKLVDSFGAPSFTVTREKFAKK